MSFRDRDGPQSSRAGNGDDPERLLTPSQECDLPLRVVFVESLSGTNSGVYRIVAGRQCVQAPNGVGFVCPVRLRGNEVYLELRSINREIRFEAATIVREAQAPDGRWRYDAVFTLPTSRVDRYEFD